MNRILACFLVGVAVFLLGCAGERQGLVCEEMEYRLNTMTYSPDQRAYAEEELRVCREQEAQKKAEGAAQRQSIYDRFAASDTTKKSSSDNSSNAKSTEKDISVSNALKDSSGVETQSIYDRYKSVEQPTENAPADIPADTSAATVESFQ